MIKFLAFIKGFEKDGKYFNEVRDAYDYINTLDVPNKECEILAVEIPE
jgi:hypothetical protein